MNPIATNTKTGHLELRAGTAKVDITPAFPVPLAGYTHFKENFSGISERMHLRLLYLEQRDQQRIIAKSLIVSADIVWFGPDRLNSIFYQIKQRCGLESSSIFLHATHNHSGPQTSEVLGYGIPNRKYIEFLEEKLAEGAVSAMKKLEPVSVERGDGKCYLGIYRRKPEDGQILFAPNEDGPSDPQVSVICFRKIADNRIKSLLVQYACHPTTKADDFISSEFPGFAMDLIEKDLGEDCTSLFLQGCSADIRPALIKDGRFYRGDDQDIRRLGGLLANEILCIIQKPLHALRLCEMTIRKLAVKLPFQRDRQDNSSSTLAQSASGILEMTWLALAEGLSIVTMNAEISVEYGLYLKKRYNLQVLPVPYTNGMIGYVSTARQIEEGGYESAVSYKNYGLPAPYDPVIEQLIYEGIDRLAQ